MRFAKVTYLPLLFNSALSERLSNSLYKGQMFYYFQKT